MQKLTIVVFGLSITSAWGNGHATTYRSLLRALARRGHEVVFFERERPWYAANRDLPEPEYCTTIIYRELSELNNFSGILNRADLLIIGSFVPDAKQLLDTIASTASGCLAYYDIDTPVTLARLEAKQFEYLHPVMIPVFDLYLSFSGGPVLEILERRWGARRARPLYCSVDPDLYCPGSAPEDADLPSILLGYLGTYSEDRQPALEKLLFTPARKRPDARFCIAGAQYPSHLRPPPNVEMLGHVAPRQHGRFYNAQRFTLNITRQNMVDAGFSPSVRLFEAAACGTPVISDYWPGLDTFFEIGREIVVARNSAEMMDHLTMAETERRSLARRLREKVLHHHTATHRAMELENYWREVAWGSGHPRAAGLEFA